MRAENQNRFLGGFLVITLSLFSLLVYFGMNRTPRKIPSMENFYTLDTSFLKGGISLYREEKKELKRNVSLLLSLSEENEVTRAAVNVAVYLFPDLLPKDHFEREVALENWFPLEHAIESHPKTDESRRSFEDLKAMIWNYENPSRTLPQLSDGAKQVIKIYDTLSIP